MNVGSVAWCSKRGSIHRSASGSATQSWTPCNDGGRSTGDSSEWLIPRPAVIRLSCPGSIVWTDPRLSRCSTAPSTSQVTVCSPVCGCGGTRMPGIVITASGPKWSTKHHAPIIRRSRCGSVRLTMLVLVIGTSRPTSSSCTARSTRPAADPLGRFRVEVAHASTLGLPNDHVSVAVCADAWRVSRASAPLPTETRSLATGTTRSPVGASRRRLERPPCPRPTRRTAPGRRTRGGTGRSCGRSRR